MAEQLVRWSVNWDRVEKRQVSATLHLLAPFEVSKKPSQSWLVVEGTNYRNLALGKPVKRWENQILTGGQ